MQKEEKIDVNKDVIKSEFYTARRNYKRNHLFGVNHDAASGTLAAISMGARAMLFIPSTISHVFGLIFKEAGKLAGENAFGKGLAKLGEGFSWPYNKIIDSITPFSTFVRNVGGGKQIYETSKTNGDLFNHYSRKANEIDYPIDRIKSKVARVQKEAIEHKQHTKQIEQQKHKQLMQELLENSPQFSKEKLSNVTIDEETRNYTSVTKTRKGNSGATNSR